ncbi:MAG: trypsin-like peptidase domain-containing protein [Tissierellia bacterium]|nr:trypsin-like peptidase domain-containing protein [Tissierellia bacterium]
MKDDERFENEDFKNESDGFHDERSHERPERYDTEKILTDEQYVKDKINSYSHYSDYGNQDSEANKFDEENYEDDFQDQGEKRFYTDNLNSNDVRRIVREEFEKNHKKGRGWLSALLYTALGSVIGLLIYTQVFPMMSKEDLSEKPAQSQTISINTAAEQNIESAVNEKSSKSIVGVTALVQKTNDFFSQGMGEYVGSGVVVSEDGYIITNSHVVNDGRASEIKVVFDDKSSVPAELLWMEPDLDLAVIKVDKTGLIPIEIGDSDDIKVGDKAIAIGNPLGLDLQSTLTSGYISGLDRSITMPNGVTMDGLIQTDAAINRGNSGGGLLNSKGQLIGINTAKAQAGEGIGFAIPIKTAATIVKKIETTKNFEPVLLGVKVVKVDYYKNMTGIDLATNDGVIVMEVVPGSPADEAGIKPNDIITNIGDSKINSRGQLKTALLAYNLGDAAKLTILRDNLSQEIDVKFNGSLN